jgi:hypothetical protein
MARYKIFNFAGRLLVVVGDSFGVRWHVMAAVASGGVRRCAAVQDGDGYLFDI